MQTIGCSLCKSENPLYKKNSFWKKNLLLSDSGDEYWWNSKSLIILLCIIPWQHKQSWHLVFYSSWPWWYISSYRVCNLDKNGNKIAFYLLWFEWKKCLFKGLQDLVEFNFIASVCFAQTAILIRVLDSDSK